MTFVLDRRQLIVRTAVLGAGLASAPSWARTAARSTTPGWKPVQEMLDATVGRKYVPGVGAALARGTDQADFLVAGRIRCGGAIR